MHKHSWLYGSYIVVGLIILSSLFYSFNIKWADLFKTGEIAPKVEALPPGMHRVQLNQSVTVKGIVYTFSKVTSDNRCLPSAECVSPGTAEIELTVGGLGAAETLHLTTDNAVSYANVNILASHLTPLPAFGTEKAEVILEITEIVNE